MRKGLRSRPILRRSPDIVVGQTRRDRLSRRADYGTGLPRSVVWLWPTSHADDARWQWVVMGASRDAETALSCLAGRWWYVSALSGAIWTYTMSSAGS
jgi:hypothetical protein